MIPIERIQEIYKQESQSFIPAEQYDEILTLMRDDGSRADNYAEGFYTGFRAAEKLFDDSIITYIARNFETGEMRPFDTKKEAIDYMPTTEDPSAWDLFAELKNE